MDKEFTWELFWGGDAKYDIAQDCEDLYESVFNKSCVYWTPFDSNVSPTDDLKNRPDIYSTHGYTNDFESWGIDVCREAYESGCRKADDVMIFIVDKYNRI